MDSGAFFSGRQNTLAKILKLGLMDDKNSNLNLKTRTGIFGHLARLVEAILYTIMGR